MVGWMVFRSEWLLLLSTWRLGIVCVYTPEGVVKRWESAVPLPTVQLSLLTLQLRFQKQAGLSDDYCWTKKQFKILSLF